MKRIVFVIYSLEGGGAERVLVNLADEFVKEYEVTIVTIKEANSFYDLDHRVKHVALGLDSLSKNGFQTFINVIRRIFSLAKTIKKLDPDVVISFMTHTNILSIIASKLIGKKIVVSEDIEYHFYQDKFLFTLRKLVYRLANGVVVKTHADRKHYGFLKNVVVIPNMLSWSEFPEMEKMRKEKIILGVGRLEKQKRFDVLIKVFRELNLKDYKLLIVGEGSERERLLKMIGDDERIRLIGRTKEIEKYYRKSEIFVLSSQKEGFGNVLIEAMAFGCACISFDCPYGPAEIIQNGVNGLLVENQNEEALKKAILKVVNDRKLYESLRRNALLARERYSKRTIAQKRREVINGIA
jgi:GalNAc-alpha-(1->4)-GalNAc-alpha-(1->3)-diNAcBac-PP-undecaprenol alpha-1,4-N-acetyl-D-galactosaminyltransferase